MDIAEKDASQNVIDEDAHSIPVPIDVPARDVLLVMYYPERGPPGKRRVAPPHYAVFVDGKTGLVKRSGRVASDDLGISRPNDTVAGVGIAQNMTAAEFQAKRARLVEISADVWTAFAAATPGTDPGVRSLVREYWQLFAQTTKDKVAPFYLQAAPTFFAWLRKAAGTPP